MLALWKRCATEFGSTVADSWWVGYVFVWIFVFGLVVLLCVGFVGYGWGV